MPHKACESEMSAAAEMSAALRVLAGGPARNGAVKHAKNIAMRVLGVSAGRAHELVHGRAKPTPEEIDRIRAEKARRERIAALQPQQLVAASPRDRLRGLISTVVERVTHRLREMVERELLAEMHRLERELVTASLDADFDPAAHALAEAETSLLQVRQALGLPKEGAA